MKGQINESMVNGNTLTIKNMAYNPMTRKWEAATAAQIAAGQAVTLYYVKGLGFVTVPDDRVR